MSAASVVITGVGMLTPLGPTAAESASAWRGGRAAKRAAAAELADTPLEGLEVALLPEFDAAERLGGRRMIKYMSEAALLGCIAAREAAAAAEIAGRFAPERVGLFAGTGLAAAGVREVRPMIEASLAEDGHISARLLGERGLAATNPLLSFKILANMPACLVSVIEGVKGPNYIFTPWEGQTGAALLEAWRAVGSGEVDCALCGAADAAAHPSTCVYLSQAGLLAEGEFPASAAAYLVLEREETARRDRRRIAARVSRAQLLPTGGPGRDPLAARMGRSFSAAPAVLLALASFSADGTVRVSGVDSLEFRAELEAVA
ncbi:MAG: beta-ketoacyl synthase N-terminal-like domain-containing protein [Planctomycetota bacterium]|jgi:3-oxoacyl-(acyl-carrier-protein) synthase